MMGYYRDTGHFDFACIADHDYISNANSYSTGSFLGINGVEASNGGPHVVGFGMSSTGSFTPGSGLQGHINNVISGGGLPMVAHPRWSAEIQSYDMSTFMRNMTNCTLMSVYNRYCERVYHNGISESYWDELLSASKVIYGYAEDDAHGSGDAGYTYNMVQTSELSAGALKTALQNGNSYFCYSTVKWALGITITDYNVIGTGAGGMINITTDVGQTIQFIGNNGAVLQTVNSNAGSYTINGSEKYVRIKVTNADGDITWIQPVFVTP
jgi:hypothetical protein